MMVIVGLGNPGKKYVRTRHNIGFRVLDKFQKENNFPDFKFSKKFNALISKGSIERKKVILVKPQTFMNNSGQAIKTIFNFQFSIFNQFLINQFLKNNLIVIHDDIDLPLGKIRISKKRGSAGHKGVESIIKELGSKNFIRLRVGIQSKEGKPKNTKKFVLQKFTKEEEKDIKETIKKTCQALKIILIQGIEKAMNKYNK